MMSDIKVKTSENDNRQYEFLILGNKLKILLVSDPTTEKGAAALNVNVGSSSDPDSVPGTAHFCEHMLFLGTEKYPIAGEFNDFLSQNGGYSNAMTYDEYTVYFFDVKSETLLPALDRFAQFFTSPLFTESFTDRELNAVDAEHKKNVLDDEWRKDFISKCTTRPGHVHHKFGTGNIETLKIVPKEKDINVREVLLEFHSTYYSANITTVVVLGKESIEELRNLVVPLFVNLVNKEVDIVRFNECPYGNDELGVMIKIPTIKDIKGLELVFMMPDMREQYKTSPWKYITHLIGHKGEGSLLMYLKKKKLWVNTLSVNRESFLRGFDFFNINMSLTDEGLGHIYDIIEVFFQYIVMLKQEEPQAWIYNEIQSLTEIKFRFKDKEWPEDYVLDLSKRMHKYEPEDVLYGSYRMDSFCPEIITEILSNINPSNFRCYIQSKAFEGKTDKVAKYYDAGYCVEKIPVEQIEKWKIVTSHPELHLPNKNIFIAENFDIVVPNQRKEIKDIPSLIKDNKHMRVWYKADDTFFLPKSYFELHINSPVANMTPAHVNNIRMYTQLIRDELEEFAYDAELAGLNYYITCWNRGLYIEMDGYNNKQLLLLKQVLHHITKLDVKEERFNVNKVKLEEDLKNTALDEPFEQIHKLGMYLLEENVWSDEERLKYMDELNVDSLKSFIKEFHKSIYLETLCFGNLLIQEAEELCEVVEKRLIEDMHAKPLLPSQHFRPREFKIPKSSNYLYEIRSKIHANSCVTVDYQIGLKEKHLNVLCDLFSQIIEAPCFNTLRTEQQLGYIVFSGVKGSTSVQRIYVLVQSDKSPSFVCDQIDNFFENFEKSLIDMSDEKFKDYIEALAVKKLEKPKYLSDEAYRYSVEIVQKTYNYRRKEMEVKELRNLSKANIIQFFKTYISPSSRSKKKLTYVILGKDAESVTDSNESWQIVDDVLKFKSGLQLYPHVTPYGGISLLSNTE